MKYETDRRPEPGEICTVGLMNKETNKQAALLFDRIYVSPKSPIATGRQATELPPQLTFGFSDAEDRMQECAMEVLSDCDPSDLFDDAVLDEVYDARQREDTIRLVELLGSTAMSLGVRAVCQAYTIEGCTVVPSFSDYSAFDREFSSGTEIAFEAALKNIKVVDPDNLEWDQILEFREDAESLRKYRDLRMWLQNGLDAESPSQAIDVIASKLDAYEWSIKKHGLGTIHGALTFVLNYKQAGVTVSATAAGAAFAGPVGAALAGGIVLAGQVSALAIKRSIDLEDVKRGENHEIAFIHDVNKKFGQSQ